MSDSPAWLDRINKSEDLTQVTFFEAAKDMVDWIDEAYAELVENHSLESSQPQVLEFIFSPKEGKLARLTKEQLDAVARYVTTLLKESAQRAHFPEHLGDRVFAFHPPSAPEHLGFGIPVNPPADVGGLLRTIREDIKLVQPDPSYTFENDYTEKTKKKYENFVLSNPIPTDKCNHYAKLTGLLAMFHDVPVETGHWLPHSEDLDQHRLCMHEVTIWSQILEGEGLEPPTRDRFFR